MGRGQVLAVVNAAVVEGVFGRPVRVEVSVTQGLPAFNIVGLPDASVREARDRVRAAIAASKLKFPASKIIVNLAPTELKKHGAALDLAIAMGVLAASKELTDDARIDLHHLGVVGELGLDGSVRRVPGLVSLADALVGREIVVPVDGAAEAAAVRPDQVRGVASLREFVDWLNGVGLRPSIVEPAEPSAPLPSFHDLADVRGQPIARYALEVAAAGGHHLLMQGPPGGGKTMLATRLPGLLPPLDAADSLLASRIHSVAGLRLPSDGLVREPPFRAPHHGVSKAAMVGGGSGVVRPGEVSAAHGGVLFLDELGEFPIDVLESLRTTLEEGVIRVSRAGVSVSLPARFQLIAAMNPCPCGLGGGDDGRCRCSDVAIDRYRRRLSAPLLDRFDLHIAVEPPDPLSLLERGEEEPTAAVRERVLAARARAAERGVGCNAALSTADLDLHAPLVGPGRRFVETALRNGALTGRGLQKIRRVARTIADLDDCDVDESVLARAMGLRLPLARSGATAA